MPQQERFSCRIELLEFWLHEVGPQGWYAGGEDIDTLCRDRFADLWQAARDGGLEHWVDGTVGTLAYLILTDQIPRNIHRGKAQAFAGDTRAQQLVRDALAQGMDGKLPWVGRVFLYMPLMHAEDLPLQEEGVRRFRQLAADAPDALRATLTSSLRFAEQHRDIIARFGRFPYRNHVLDRSGTALELDFLSTGPRFGQ